MRLEDRGLLGAGMLIGAQFAITSNVLVQTLCALGVCFIAAYLLMALLWKSGAPRSGLEFLYRFGILCASVTLETFSLQTVREFSAPGRARRLVPTPRSRVTACALVISLMVFHPLFAKVNEEYRAFMLVAFRMVWDVLSYIFDIRLIWQSIAQSYLIYAVLRVGTLYDEELVLSPSEAMRFALLLFPTALLFAVFGVFQGKLVLMDPRTWSFADLSLYTQKGFWELLWVAALGYALWHHIMRKVAPDSPQYRETRAPLAIFAAELLLISLFSAHKLVVLQALFGLKDQRVVASAAVLLIACTFIMSLGQVWGWISASSVFAAQRWGFVTVVLLLTSINLELTMTRLHPIRMVNDGSAAKDYSYLLTNSYDNSDEWLPLMREAMEIGLVVPEHYYWGYYAPLCERLTDGRIIDHFGAHLDALEAKYADTSPHVLSFKLREFRAFQLVREHQGEIERFHRFLAAWCDATAPQARKPWEPMSAGL